ncbi:MAG TPA: alkaline phosphatase family protein [Solirubrobacteraceae bacterium]|nr:alkaline phosphatase family protein [Solirubrobacteraceae bacterium]
MKKLLLAVIDGARPAMLEQAASDGHAPALAALLERGSYEPRAVSAFPSVTPVCAATIATGLGPDRHLVPSMNWYDRAQARYVEYGSSFRASLRFGLGRQLTDLVYNMNGEHLASDALTIFERLDDAGLRTACTTYLIFRGRHSHQPAQDSALTRIAALSLIRRPVMGPGELFYADIFSSRDTGCRSTLGLPGVRDRHAGCVGEYLVANDLFDFLLLSLPDNDNHSHKQGPDAQVAAIAQADRAIARVFDAAGGAEQFLASHAVIVVADHAHTLVERSVSLARALGSFDVRRPTDMRALEASQIAVCPAQRAAMIYVFGGAEMLERVLARARALDGVDHVIWREDGQACVARGPLELRFEPGDEAADLRGRSWRLHGDLDALGLTLLHGVVSSDEFPDALGRVWDATGCATAGEVLLTAAEGVEFSDWGGADHVGGGSHGSLSAGDSYAPLIRCGLDGQQQRTHPEGHGQWSIADVAPLITAHFGVS